VTIYKHLFELVILNEDENYDPTKSSSEEDDGLEQMSYDMREGYSIGMMTKKGSEPIEDENQVRAELIAIGNDGSFFDPDPDE